MSESIQNPCALDATHWTRALLAAAIAFGGEVVTIRQGQCYDSTSGFGTPSYKPAEFDKEKQAWSQPTSSIDVTKHDIRWPLSADNKTTGPTIYQIAAKIGMPMSTEALSISAESEGLIRLTIFEHDTLTAKNGWRGQGIVVATTARPSPGVQEDQRGCKHFVTNVDGSLRFGLFA